jgi:hypothetical protein
MLWGCLVVMGCYGKNLSLLMGSREGLPTRWPGGITCPQLQPFNIWEIITEAAPIILHQKRQPMMRHTFG